MDIDFMRRMDRIFGVPICFVLTIWHKVSQAFRSKASLEPRKILVLQISEMGSAIHAFTSINILKQRFPKAKIYYLIFDEMKKSVELLSQIPKEQILTIRSKSISGFAFDTIKNLWFLQRQKIDVSIDYELFSRFSAIMSFMSGAKERVGFHRFAMEGLYRGKFLTQEVIYNHTAPVGTNFIALTKSVGQLEAPLLKETIIKPEVPKIMSLEKEKAAIWKKLQKSNPKVNRNSKLVIINPNASQLLPLRRWPIHYYVELSRKILTDENVFVIITGIASEKPEAKELCKKLGTRCIDLTGETTLRELIDLYNICHLMISNDSGPPNFASLTKMETIVLFGPETPICYAPIGGNIHVMYSHFCCSPCVSAYNHRKSYCTDNKCLQAIKPNEVYELARQLINKGA